MKKRIKKSLSSEKSDIKDIFRRIKKRDFSGNTGLAVKNSIFQFSTTIVAKIGSLIFTIILARLLMPELFGLYSLAFSTIMIFAAFSTLGVGQAMVKFLASAKSSKKAKAYFSYLIKVKLILTLASASALIFLSRFLAVNYYNKPILLALLAGIFYLIFSGFAGVFEGIFKSSNNFKKSFYKEILFQSFRVILIPLAILLTINQFSTQVLLFSVFIALSFSSLFAFVFLIISARKEISFLKIKKSSLDKKEKSNINKFIIALSAMVISLTFFGNIDMFVLGRYVESEFLGFYRAAYTLITSAIPLISFSGALFPLFSKLKGKQLERGLRKTRNLTLLIALPFFTLTFLLAPLVIRIIYGQDYSPAGNLLRLFAILIILGPLITIYSSFLISQNKPKKVAQSLIFSTILNIILNYIFIIALIPYGNLAAVYGATAATILSKIFYLALLTHNKKAQTKKDNLIKPKSPLKK